MKLSSTQRSIVDHDDGALLVVAGPGSGKTRVLTERMRRLLTASEGHFQVLALTFTNKAANEMKDRLEEFSDIQQRAFIGTLHSFCSEVLGSRGKAVGINNHPTVFEQFKDRKEVLRQAMLGDPVLRPELEAKAQGKERERALSDWLEAIGEAKASLLVPDAVQDEDLRQLYMAYDAGLRASGAIDYDDLLLLTYRLFIERPKIASFYRRLYRYICIDEAQDLNEAQYRLIQALCGDTYRNVMMVGDPQQAIFQWNGAHPKYLDLFESEFGARCITLNENYRSSLAVVEAARSLAGDYEADCQFPIPGEVRLLVGSDEEDEARQVVSYLRTLLAGGHEDIEGEISLDRCAVLARTRYALVGLEDAIREEGWPYYKRLSAQHESESRLLQDFELALRLLGNHRDRLHLDILARRWGIDDPELAQPFGSSAELLERLATTVADENHKMVLAEIQKLDQEFRFTSALDAFDKYADSLDSEDERALIVQDVNAWRHHWDGYVRGNSADIRGAGGFMGQVALGATQQPKRDGLALLTVHSAKGLEYDVVVVMGMMEGVFPDYRARGEALDEEKRNLFVAITRSKRLLCLTYAETRMMPWGDLKGQQPSRFLRQLELQPSSE